jgi:hypothetical protein
MIEIAFCKAMVEIAFYKAMVEIAFYKAIGMLCQNWGYLNYDFVPLYSFFY